MVFFFQTSETHTVQFMLMWKQINFITFLVILGFEGRDMDFNFLLVTHSDGLNFPGWPRHREFGSYFFQTGKTQGILF